MSSALVLLIGALMTHQPTLPFATLARGELSSIEDARQLVVRTPNEWRGLWREHGGGDPAPAVDFRTATVVAIFLGTRNTAGYEVEIVAVRQEEGGAVVEYVERRPGPGMMVPQVLTAPFHLVRVARIEGDVRFVKIDAPPVKIR